MRDVVWHADLFQLRRLALPLLVPDGLGEWSILLISSVDLRRRQIRFGDVVENPTKDGTSFNVR